MDQRTVTARASLGRSMDRFNPGSWFWKSLCTLSLLTSFILANLGFQSALKLWTDDWAGVLAIFSMLYGLSWARDLASQAIEAKRDVKPSTEAEPKVVGFVNGKEE